MGNTVGRAALLSALLMVAGVTASAAAEEGAEPGTGPWQLEVGALAGFYDFDSLTRFEDGPIFGLRLGARRSRCFQLESEFTEVYTSRQVTNHSARQMTVALHGRLHWPMRKWDPSLLFGLAFVGLDDSDDTDSFGEAWDLGLGLGYRVSAQWTLRGEWLLRSQRFSVIDPNLSPQMQSDEVVGSWARSWLVGLHYAFPPDPAPLGPPTGDVESFPAGAERRGRALYVGVHAGNWNFNDAFRYEDEVLYGLSVGAWIASEFSLEIDLERIDTRIENGGGAAQLGFLNLHGRYRWRPENAFAPGVLVGVSFMTADLAEDADSITEGFDIGPSLQWRLSGRSRMFVDLLFRYTSVRVTVPSADPLASTGDEIRYVWSNGARLGVDFAF